MIVNYLLKYNTVGMIIDADTISAYYGWKKHNILIWENEKIYMSKIFKKINKTNCINVFIERNPKKIPVRATNHLMINQEFVNSYMTDNIKNGSFNKVICKTPIAEQVVKKISRNANAELIEFEPKSNFIAVEPDKNIFIHLSGVSPLKNTISIFNAWYKSNKLKNSSAKLIIAIRRPKEDNKFFHPVTNFFDYIDELAGDKHSLQLGAYSIDCLKFTNIYIIDKFLPNDVYAYLQAVAYTHVCPSLVEGFGHYIWEPAINGRRVITTDAEPMISVARKASVIYHLEKKVVSIRNPLRGLTLDEKKKINTLTIGIPVKEEKSVYEVFGRYMWYPKYLPFVKCYYVDEQKFSKVLSDLI